MKIMDLGDFVPQPIQIRFQIEGRYYEFNLPEATVDEVLRLMLADQGTEDIVTKKRHIVTDFLCSHIEEKKREQLQEDLAKVPFMMPSAAFDISRLYEAIQGATPKKGLGAEMPPESD